MLKLFIFLDIIKMIKTILIINIYNLIEKKNTTSDEGPRWH